MRHTARAFPVGRKTTVSAGGISPLIVLQFSSASGEKPPPLILSLDVTRQTTQPDTGLGNIWNVLKSISDKFPTLICLGDTIGVLITAWGRHMWAGTIAVYHVSRV